MLNNAICTHLLLRAIVNHLFLPSLKRSVVIGVFFFFFVSSDRDSWDDDRCGPRCK